jgi:hypothetical protein
MRRAVLLAVVFQCGLMASPCSSEPDSDPVIPAGVPPMVLFQQVYSDIFRLSDGSRLGGGDSRAVDAMQSSVQRLLAAGSGADLLGVARDLPDEDLLRVLFLAVVGNFTTDQSPSALPQRCALVVDAASGRFVLKDSGSTQSVILEVLLIVSIVCLVRAWGSI